ncbi:MAG: amino acid ABC transporter permease [Labrys sp. (in: a-proteobacteria)]
MLDLLIEQAPRFFTWNNFLLIAQGAGVTLLLTAIGCGVGGVMGFALTLVRTSTSLWLLPFRLVALLYVELFRRIPFIVVLFIVLYSIQVVAPRSSQFTIATIAICLVSTAFLAEIIRAGFESVPRQQIEAAETLNFPRWLTIRAIVLPQAWKVILPPAIAFVVMFIKDTALASQMGVIELTFVGRTLNNRGFSSFMVFGTILLVYFAMSWPLARLGRHLEARLAASRA